MEREELRKANNNVSMCMDMVSGGYFDAETFDADSTPRFIPVEVIKYDAWWTRRYGREYNPMLFGLAYDDSYAVCVRDIPIAHFDTKEKAENHANTVRTAISVVGGVTPSTIDHPLALTEMDGYADKNIRGGMNMAETFNADYSLYDRKAKQKVGVKSGYDDYKDAYDDWENEIIKEYPNRVSENEWIVIDTHSAETFEAEQCKHEEYYVIGMDGDEWNDGGENFAMLEIECESCGVRGKGETNLSYDTAPNREHNSIWWEDIGFEAETFNAYKVAPALSSYSKDELISSKAGPQGSASRAPPPRRSRCWPGPATAAARRHAARPAARRTSRSGPAGSLASSRPRPCPSRARRRSSARGSWRSTSTPPGLWPNSTASTAPLSPASPMT